MSKKKKKKKNYGILPPIEKELNQTYDSLVEEIEAIQTSVAAYEQRQLKKERKKLRKNPSHTINMNKIREDARVHVVNRMESTNLMDRVESSFKDFSSTCILLARCVAALIVCILSIDAVKTRIGPNTLRRLEAIYKIAIGIR